VTNLITSGALFYPIFLQSSSLFHESEWLYGDPAKPGPSKPRQVDINCTKYLHRDWKDKKT